MMDEFKRVKNVSGSMNFIYADALTHPIVDIVEDHRLFSLKRYFNRFPLKERQKVKTITIDIYPPYINLIRNMFPNAHIIIDRFHIVQSIHRALNMARVSAMNDLKNAHRPDYNKCKRYWKLVLKPTENLESFEYKKMRLFKEWKTEKGVVKHILALNSTLERTYHYVNQLRTCIKTNNFSALVTTLSMIDLSLTHKKFKPVVETLLKYTDFIKNTLTYTNLTNGPIEGINNKIKLIKRVSYGYRNYNHLRNRIILCSKLYAYRPKKRLSNVSLLNLYN